MREGWREREREGIEITVEITHSSWAGRRKDLGKNSRFNPGVEKWVYEWTLNCASPRLC